jgi:cytochrome c551/c552
VAYGVLAAAFAVAMTWSVVQERAREWRATEAAFERLLASMPGERRLAGDDRGVQQLWLQDMDRVDRCATCHRGIDDPAFTRAAEPFRTHPGSWLSSHPVDRFGCTPCHGGQGEATTFADAAHHPRPDWPLQMRRGAVLEAGCGTCHRERRPPGTPVLAAGRDTIARAGCAGCHEIPGFTTDGVRAPNLESVAWKARPGWLRRYLEKPALIAGARMPDFRLTPAELDRLDAFLGSLRKVAPLDASGVDWSRADAERGRELYARARCVTCHRVDERGGTVGPDLSTIGSRVTREWLWSYLQDPFRDQPDTLMPRFSLGPAEARDIAIYLSEELTDPEAPDDPVPTPPLPSSLVEAGRTVFVKRGCFGCHRLPGMTDLARIGPSLAGVGERALEAVDFRGQRVEPTLANWLYLKLRAPQDLIAASSMPTFALADTERASVVVALLSLPRRDPPASLLVRDAPLRPWTPQGEAGALFTRYRCLSCHQLEGKGERLSTVVLDRIGSQLQPEYLRTFLREPGTVRVGLDVRMPRMNISESEAATLVDFARRLLVDDRLAAWSTPGPQATIDGKALYDRLGCRGCHQIGRDGGYIGPDLSAVGRRLQPGWMKAWLQAPERWKAGTLQPDYGLTDAESVALTAYMLTLTREERR